MLCGIERKIENFISLYDNAHKKSGEEYKFLYDKMKDSE